MTHPADISQLRPRNARGQLAAYTWPDRYPVAYYVRNGGTLCPRCARQADEEYLMHAYVNWGDSDLYCVHCNTRITSAYGEDES